MAQVWKISVNGLVLSRRINDVNQDDIYEKFVVNTAKYSISDVLHEMFRDITLDRLVSSIGYIVPYYAITLCQEFHDFYDIDDSNIWPKSLSCSLSVITAFI